MDYESSNKNVKRNKLLAEILDNIIQIQKQAQVSEPEGVVSPEAAIEPGPVVEGDVGIEPGAAGVPITESGVDIAVEDKGVVEAEDEAEDKGVVEAETGIGTTVTPVAAPVSSLETKPEPGTIVKPVAVAVAVAEPIPEISPRGINSDIDVTIGEDLREIDKNMSLPQPPPILPKETDSQVPSKKIDTYLQQGTVPPPPPPEGQVITTEVEPEIINLPTPRVTGIDTTEMINTAIGIVNSLNKERYKIPSDVEPQQAIQPPIKEEIPHTVSYPTQAKKEQINIENFITTAIGIVDSLSKEKHKIPSEAITEEAVKEEEGLPTPIDKKVDITDIMKQSMNVIKSLDEEIPSSEKKEHITEEVTDKGITETGDIDAKQEIISSPKEQIQDIQPLIKSALNILTNLTAKQPLPVKEQIESGVDTGTIAEQRILPEKGQERDVESEPQYSETIADERIQKSTTAPILSVSDIITPMIDHSDQITANIIESNHTKSYLQKTAESAKKLADQAAAITTKALGIAGLKRSKKLPSIPSTGYIIQPIKMEQGQVSLDMEPTQIIFNQTAIRDEQPTDEDFKKFSEDIEAKNKDYEKSDPKQTIMVKINPDDKPGMEKIEVILPKKQQENPNTTSVENKFDSGINLTEDVNEQDSSVKNINIEEKGSVQQESKNKETKPEGEQPAKKRRRAKRNALEETPVISNE